MTAWERPKQSVDRGGGRKARPPGQVRLCMDYDQGDLYTLTRLVKRANAGTKARFLRRLLRIWFMVEDAREAEGWGGPDVKLVLMRTVPKLGADQEPVMDAEGKPVMKMVVRNIPFPPWGTK